MATSVALTPVMDGILVRIIYRVTRRWSRLKDVSLVTTRLRFIEPQLAYLGRAVARGQALTLTDLFKEGGFCWLRKREVCAHSEAKAWVIEFHGLPAAAARPKTR